MMRLRSPWLLSAGAATAIAACSVYGDNLVGTGGAGGSASTTSTAAGGMGGATTTSTAAGGMGGATTSSTSSTTTSSTSASSTSSTTTSSSSSSTSTTSNSSSSSGGTNAVLVLSQIKSRGLNGGVDEWVEIYNPGSTPVTFDSTWSVSARNATLGLTGCATVLYGPRFSGGGQVIPAHAHILFGYPTGFSEAATTPADAPYAGNFGIPDAASVILVHGATVIDALCFYYDATTQATLGCPGNPFTCSGTPVLNPHDNTPATDDNASLERKPGGPGGNTQDTHDNATDFATRPAADPHNLASTAVP